MTGTEATDTSDVTEQRPQWSLATLIAFRFGTCYFGSFGLALVIGLIPVILAGIGIDGPWSAVRGLIQLMRPPIEWIGTRLLGLHVEGTQVGSDSAFQWTALFCIARSCRHGQRWCGHCSTYGGDAMTGCRHGCGRSCASCSLRRCSISGWRR